MNSFKSNCTLPPDGTAFVASPDVRGTFDVVWSCISVLLICTWSILHLNIPVQSTPRTKVQKYVRASFRTCTKIKWMLMNVVAPEWALGKAWSDYRSVASLEASFKPYEWSRSHIYLANMGGFAISFPSSTMADSKATERDIWILDASQLLLALKLGIIAELPYVSEDELNDRSKSDVFVKLIAVGQIIWFLIQLVSRLARRIATSQLEIMTLAFAACTVVTYALLLDKPKDVQTTITIPAKRYATAAEMNRLANMGPASYLTNRGRNVCIPNNAIHAEDGSSSGGVVALSAGAAFSVLIFGGFHCLAWNFTFPTPAERVLWQAASIFTAAFVPAFVPASWGIATVVILAWKKFRPPPPREKSPSGARFSASDTGMGVSTTLFVGGVLLFFAARVFIVVEVLRTMAFLPPGAFETTWSSELLHIG
ncbi:uncharacterized protein LY89DRAFT_585846 [Mollisia scopiformis]|uniref:Uncharacterized protein n=1 Tax=Mollisia scopiformis TaxID=149040 RepID=A0A194X9Y0_MOLSC|nr:uncharacterized protein LY89DRAFT_585846 [Mollisia scopiformis]KUJ16975.1 hypothetical protein LY89DRAFT_585846 [Mollisia scopiformis]